MGQFAGDVDQSKQIVSSKMNQGARIS